MDGRGPLKSANHLEFVTWSGEYSSWQDYVRRVRLAYERTEKRKRKLLGAELVSRLKGKAWEVSVEVDHSMLCKSTGPRYLLRFLEERLLKTPINDLGLRLEDMFVKLRRQPATGMAQWAMQVRECYRMLKRSLGKLKATKSPLTKKNVKKLGDGRAGASQRGRASASGQEQKRSIEEPEPPQDEGSGRRSATTALPADQVGQASREPLRDDEEELQAVQETWDKRSTRSRWSARDWKKWEEGRWVWKGDEDSSSDSSDSEIQWEEFLHDEEVVPEEVLGWLLLRKSGLHASARLAAQSAIQGDLTFDKVERTLRDQEEELLSDERYGRGGHRNQHPKRTYWVEIDGVWGILPDDQVEDVADDAILWRQGDSEGLPEPEEEAATAWTVTSSGNQLEWTFWEDEWYTLDDDGCWWSQAETQPWLDIEEVMAVDEKTGQEMAELYGQFEAKRRSFQESRQVVKNKLLGRGFFPPKGKGKRPKGGKGKGSGQVF